MKTLNECITEKGPQMSKPLSTKLGKKKLIEAIKKIAARKNGGIDADHNNGH